MPEALGKDRQSSVPSQSFTPDLFSFSGDISWSTEDFVRAHNAVKNSGEYNFIGCKIPIPTTIRYDKIRKALGGQITIKEERTLNLLKYGMPLNCDDKFGIRKVQRNHKSATNFKNEVGIYLAKNVENKAILGPFKSPPLQDLCFSPLMSVPKEHNKRRIIVDFSFPPGCSINDGIPKSTYLEFDINFSLPTVNSMVQRLNELGLGCLMYKRDLSAAFRQFSYDPGDYRFTGLEFDGLIYFDTRLAMGLRSSAYCCQSVTEMIAKIAQQRNYTLVYLDDFGGAEAPDKAVSAFIHLGKVLSIYGLQEAYEKAVEPTTSMDWLGVHFDTMEWTMSLKPGKLQELLTWLPKLLMYKRVNRVLLQKVLGNLVWAAAVLRAGVVFFNRLLALLRKLKRPHHSIYFSKEAKKDVRWWLKTLEFSSGKSSIPPAVWTPLTSLATDASLDGFGLVWGYRLIAGIFPMEFEELDINKKEMLAIVLAVKHWFSEFANSKVLIFLDNQVCMALLNYGVTRSPFLAACLREINYFLVKYNIEIKAKYISSKDNKIADICSRAFSSDLFLSKFNKLLSENFKLDYLYYDKFDFESNC